MIFWGFQGTHRDAIYLFSVFQWFHRIGGTFTYFFNAQSITYILLSFTTYSMSLIHTIKGRILQKHFLFTISNTIKITVYFISAMTTVYKQNFQTFVCLLILFVYKNSGF